MDGANIQLSPEVEGELAALSIAPSQGAAQSLPPALSLDELSTMDLGENHPIITGVLDGGTKMMIVGKAKAGKTYLGLALAVHIAAGKSFGDLEIAAPHRVMYVNYELRDFKILDRCKRILSAVDVVSDDQFESIVKKNLFFVNLRGIGTDPEDLVDHIISEAERIQPAVVFLDPLYLLLDGNENDSNVAREAAFDIDCIINKTRAALVYLHHDTKGKFPADRSNVDRGSGSGLIGRHWDSQITLTPHADSSNAVVLDFENRDYEPHPMVALERRDGCFVPSKLAAIKQDKKSEQAGRLKAEERAKNIRLAIEHIVKILEGTDRILTSDVRRWLRSNMFLSERNIDGIIYSLPSAFAVGAFPLRLIRMANNRHYFEKIGDEMVDSQGSSLREGELATP